MIWGVPNPHRGVSIISGAASKIDGFPTNSRDHNLGRLGGIAIYGCTAIRDAMCPQNALPTEHGGFS